MSLEPLEPQVAVRRLSQAVGLDLLQRFLELRVFLFVFRIHLRRRFAENRKFLWHQTAMSGERLPWDPKKIKSDPNRSAK